jgi:hypothetical protein
MPIFPTPYQNIALDLTFLVMGEERINRTQEEYFDIAARLPPLKQLTHLVNERLKEVHEKQGDLLPQICRFKAGHERIVYEPFPTRISYETLRAALTISGMRNRRSPRSRK